MKGKLTIGITAHCRKCHWDIYANWIKGVDPDIDVLRISNRDYVTLESGRFDGMLLAGGQDVHPLFYGKPEYYKLLNPTNVAWRRDEFELEVIRKTLQQQKPLLGICRGLQITNVYFGGTLIPDIPLHFQTYEHLTKTGKPCVHEITVKKNTLLSQIVQTKKGEVFSAHHQSVDRIGKGLCVNAVAKKGIIEGMEIKDDGSKNLLLLLQWHPERMKNMQSGFSKNIRDYFLNEIKKTI
ncbi:MAG: gamma-glutamyl-gamma-aminobutyrate hydrolase family protein [Sphingobacteriales bacterium]|nr:MAG: gamma-glutamyl-gamma-aminobutyrate hydrolase family protein [Sphingobacteriales bacterium]